MLDALRAPLGRGTIRAVTGVRVTKLRFSHENPDVQALYTEFLKEPCGELSHHLLHTEHTGWEA